MKSTELKKIRERLGMTTSELAAATGLHVVTICRYESGSRRITEEFAEKVNKLVRKKPITIKSSIEQFKKVAKNIGHELCSDQGAQEAACKPTILVRTKFCTPLNSMCEANCALLRARAELGSIDDSQYTDDLATLDDIIAQLQKLRSSTHARQREVLKYIEGV